MCWTCCPVIFGHVTYVRNFCTNQCAFFKGPQSHGSLSMFISPSHIQLNRGRDYEIRLSRTDITCGPVYILAVQAGCSGVSGPISPSIQGEKATETSTRQGNRRTGYAKYSLRCLVIQLPLTIGSTFRDLIHKERVWDISGVGKRHGILNVGRSRDFLHIVAIVGVSLENNLGSFKSYFSPADGRTKGSQHIKLAVGLQIFQLDAKDGNYLILMIATMWCMP